MTEEMQIEKQAVARRLWAILNNYCEMTKPSDWQQAHMGKRAVDEHQSYSGWAYAMDNRRPFTADDTRRLQFLFKLAVDQGLLPTNYHEQPFAAIRELLNKEI